MKMLIFMNLLTIPLFVWMFIRRVVLGILTYVSV
jgi:hypothetical protein